MLRADAAIALAEGRPEEAARLYRESDIGYCILCALPGLAAALEAMGDRAAAIDAWRKYVDTPWFWRMFGNQYQQGPRLGPALETVARLYDEAGDAEKSAVYYARFLDLWADADPELQPRVETARARLEEIVRERG
jgi:tetratricopeptide (TPR) repeat protein